MVIGGFMIGWPIWARFPGPFTISADSRSVDAEGIATAQWTLAALGPNNREVADRSQRLIEGTYGHQEAVSGYGNTYVDNSAANGDGSCPNLLFFNSANNNCVSVDSKQLIIAPDLLPHPAVPGQPLTPDPQAIAFDGDVNYVIFDRRIFAGLPASGIYVERGELGRFGGPLDLTDPDQGVNAAPGSGPGPSQLAQISKHEGRLNKYDGGPTGTGWPGVNRIYDSGDMQVYDISVWGSWK
jgi:hypothetical protein